MLHSMCGGTCALLVLYVAAFLGPVFFWIPCSTEIAAATAGRYGLVPPLVGFACAAGHTTVYALIYLLGDRISTRLRWARLPMERVALKHSHALQHGSLGATFSSTLVGVPPTLAVFSLAPSLKLRLPPMLLVLSVGRFARFTAIALFAQSYSFSIGPHALMHDHGEFARATLNRREAASFLQLDARGEGRFVSGRRPPPADSGAAATANEMIMANGSSGGRGAREFRLRGQQPPAAAPEESGRAHISGRAHESGDQHLPRARESSTGIGAHDSSN